MKKYLITFSAVILVSCMAVGCSTGKQTTQIPNPTKEVESSKDFSFLGLELEAPYGATEIEYSIIGNNLAQIRFMADEMQYTLRAAKTNEDISGVYDEYKDEPTVVTQKISSDELVEVTIKRTFDGGHVAIWNYNKIIFCLVNLEPMEDEAMALFACLVCEVSCDLNLQA